MGFSTWLKRQTGRPDEIARLACDACEDECLPNDKANWDEWAEYAQADLPIRKPFQLWKRHGKSSLVSVDLLMSG